MENVKTEIRVGQAIRVDKTTLLPIERVVISASRGHTGLQFTARKEPFALVVEDGGRLHAFDREAQPMAVSALRQEVPNLDDLLEILRSEPDHRHQKNSE